MSVRRELGLNPAELWRKAASQKTLNLVFDALLPLILHFCLPQSERMTFAISTVKKFHAHPSGISLDGGADLPVSVYMRFLRRTSRETMSAPQMLQGVRTDDAML